MLLEQSKVVKVLLEACREVIKSREERWGRLPIHIACCSKASVDVLRVLVETHTDSLRIADKMYSRLPLHYVCRFGSQNEISVILDAEQRALVFKDAGGKTPMDLALKSCQPEKTFIVKHLKERTLKVADTIIKRKEMTISGRRCKSLSPPQEKTKGKSRSKKERKTIRKSNSVRKPKRILHANNEEISIATPKKSNSTHGRNSLSPSEVCNHNQSSVSQSTPKSSSPSGSLAKFLEDHSLGPSDEDEVDALSRAAQSMPTYMYPVTEEEMKQCGYAYDDLFLVKTGQKENCNLQNMRKNGYSTLFDDKNKKISNQEYYIGRGSSAKFWHVGSAKAADQVDTMQSPSKKGIKCTPYDSYQLGRLASFLQNFADSRSDDEDRDHTSRDAKSMPTCMGIDTIEKKKNCHEGISIAGSIIQYDPSNSSFYDLNHMKRSSDTAESQNGFTDEAEEISRIEFRVSALQDIRNSLRFEYEKNYEMAMKAEHKVKLSKLNVSNIQFQIAQLQVQLDKEQGILRAAEKESKEHNESLKVQEKKINNINLKRKRFIEQKKRMVVNNPAHEVHQSVGDFEKRE